MAIWYSATAALVVYFALLAFYLLRRRRLCYDLDESEWEQFRLVGEVLFLGYLFHYIPYFFVERTLFLHHYLPAFTFKALLLAAVVEHLYSIARRAKMQLFMYSYLFLLFIWMFAVIYIFKRFSAMSYGTTDLSLNDIISLRWKDTWDFIVHKN